MVPRRWTTSGCSVRLSTHDPAAEDIFQLALVARAAAFLVRECVTDFPGLKLGGKLLVGPKQEFNVTVIGARISEKLGDVASS